MSIKTVFDATQKYCDQCSEMIKENVVSQEFANAYKQFSLKICECAVLIQKLQESTNDLETYKLADRVVAWDQQSVNMYQVVINGTDIANNNKCNTESKQKFTEKV